MIPYRSDPSFGGESKPRASGDDPSFADNTEQFVQ